MERTDYFKKLTNIRNEVIEDIKKQLGIRNLNSLDIIKWTDDCDIYNGGEDDDIYLNIISKISICVTDRDGFDTIPAYITSIKFVNNELTFKCEDVYTNEEYTMYLDDISTIELVWLLEMMFELFEYTDNNEIRLQ